MPIQVQGPDGQLLEFPDGTDRETMRAAMQKRYGGPQQPKPDDAINRYEQGVAAIYEGSGTDRYGSQAQAQPAQPASAAGTAYDPTAGMSGVERFIAGMGRSVAETGRGLQQAGTEAANRTARVAAVGLNRLGATDAARSVVGAAGVPLANSLAEQGAQAAENRRLDAPLMATGTGMAGNITGAALQSAIPMGGAGSRLAGLAGKAAPYAGAAARGAAYAGAQPVLDGESRASNAAIGGAAGAVGQGVASGLGRAATGAKAALSGPVRQSIDAAKKAGIPLHVSQVANSRMLKAVASVLESLPFTGAGSAAARQQQAFNRAVGRTFGLEDAATLGDDVMAQARKGIGQVYDDIFSRNQVSLSNVDLARMAKIESDAVKDLTADKAQVVRNQFQRIIDDFADGPVEGGKYQSLREALREAGAGNDTKVGGAIKRLRDALDEAASRSVGKADAATLKEANRMWANMRLTEKALQQASGAGSQGGGAAGNVRPSALFPLVKNGSTQDMRELAKIGQNVLKDPINNSGTAERNMAYQLLGLGTGTWAASNDSLPMWARVAGGGLVAGRAMNSPLVARALLASQPARAGATNALARLAQTAPYALPAAAHAAGQPMEINVAGGRVGPEVTEAELAELRKKGRTR